MKLATMGVVAGIVVGTLVLSSHGEVPPTQWQSTFPPTLPEPTTEPPTTPNPGDEQPPRDPFTPYSIGNVDGWSYAELTPAEQAVVDRGADTTSWQPVHAAFNAATISRAHAVLSEAAGVELGVPDLAAIGVVP